MTRGAHPVSRNTTPSSTLRSRSYRNSQYAEVIANPLPEAVVTSQETELEPFPRFSDPEQDSNECSTLAVVEPDDISDHRSSAMRSFGHIADLQDRRHHRTRVSHSCRARCCWRRRFQQFQQ